MEIGIGALTDRIAEVFATVIAVVIVNFWCKGLLYRQLHLLTVRTFCIVPRSFRKSETPDSIVIAALEVSQGLEVSRASGTICLRCNPFLAEIFSKFAKDCQHLRKLSIMIFEQVMPRFQGVLYGQLTKRLVVAFGMHVDFLNREWKCRHSPILLSSFIEKIRSHVFQLLNDVHGGQLVDMDMQNEGTRVILGQSGVIALVEVFDHGLDSFWVLLGQVDIRIFCFLSWY